MRKEKEVTENLIVKSEKSLRPRFFVAKLRNVVKFAIACDLGHKWPMHFSESPGIVINTVAMIFRLWKPVSFYSEAGRIAESVSASGNSAFQ